jgi:hypothetical protein
MILSVPRPERSTAQLSRPYSLLAKWTSRPADVTPNLSPGPSSSVIVASTMVVSSSAPSEGSSSMTNISDGSTITSSTSGIVNVLLSVSPSSHVTEPVEATKSLLSRALSSTVENPIEIEPPAPPMR